MHRRRCNAVKSDWEGRKRSRTFAHESEAKKKHPPSAQGRPQGKLPPHQTQTGWQQSAAHKPCPAPLLPPPAGAKPATRPPLPSAHQPPHQEEGRGSSDPEGLRRPVQLLTRSESTTLCVALFTALPALPRKATVPRATADSLTASAAAAARSEIFSLWSISWACARVLWVMGRWGQEKNVLESSTK